MMNRTGRSLAVLAVLALSACGEPEAPADGTEPGGATTAPDRPAPAITNPGSPAPVGTDVGAVERDTSLGGLADDSVALPGR